MEQALRMAGITKVFPRVVANDDVHIEANKGEILAIIGENGAGKSTLMSILYGLYQPDAGEIFLYGKKEEIHSPKQAIELGIGMVFQHFMLVPTLTVYENIIFGQEPTRGGIQIDAKAAIAECNKIVRQYGLEIDVTQKVENLSLGIQQRVEIIRAMYRDAKILILDEPTAVLTPGETKELFKTLREFANRGKTIIFITHKLKEVMALSDKITVLRKGKTICTVATKDTTEEEIAQMMVGRSVVLRVEKKAASPGEKVIEVENLHTGGHGSAGALKGLSFSIRQGEILGIAGIEGNGQTELLEAFTGLRKVEQGAIKLNGEDIANLTPRQIRQKKVIHIPEDRHKRGLVLDFTVEENLIAGIQFTPRFAGKAGFLNKREISRNAEEQIEKYDIRGGDKQADVRSFSGGNQQKIIIAREFEQEHAFLLASQPTRGVDIGAIEFIHKKIIETRDEGKAVLLISADLNEVLSLSDRIGVLFEGRLVGIVDAAEASEMQLGLMMSGAAGTGEAGA